MTGVGALVGAKAAVDRLRRSLAAEFAKLRTLPAVPFAALAALVVAAVIAWAYAAQRDDEGHLLAMRAADAVAGALPYAQLGVVLLGVLPFGHEVAGRVLRTSLAAVPSRGTLVTSKTLATAMVAAVAGALAAIAAWSAAVLAGARPGEPGETVRLLAAAALYLMLIALLAHAIALLVESIVFALTASLVLVLILPPLLSGLGEIARWLPEQAAAAWYLESAGRGTGGTGSRSVALLDPGLGVLVALAWIAVLLCLGAWRLTRRD